MRAPRTSTQDPVATRANRHKITRTSGRTEAISSIQFSALLQRLDPDPEKAGVEFVRMNQRLRIFFMSRGFTDAESLADRTIDRTIRRLAQVREIRSFVLGVARRIAIEVRRNPRMVSLQDMPEIAAKMAGATSRDDRREEYLRCMAACVEQLTTDEQQLLTEWHSFDGREKILRRARLAETRGITKGHLRIIMFRLKARLRKAIKQRMGGDDLVPSRQET